MTYDFLFRHGLARVDAERAHRLGFRAIRTARPVLARSLRRAKSPVELQEMSARHAGCVNAMGLAFPNVLGLSAGFDKNAVGIDALAALGFGHVEVGTVTAEPQPGNPRPRLFRLPEDRAVINRMGFNNDGAEVVAQRLASRVSKGHSARVEGTFPATQRVVVGVNIGKSRVVAEDDAEAVAGDYAKSARLLAPYADYLVVNVSSPNTPGLRDLQAVERLEPLLATVRRTADEATGDRRVPLAVKISPDLAVADVQAVADLALTSGLDAIIATNTTTSREGLRTASATLDRIGAGGLSGPPLRDRATTVVRQLRERVGPDLTVIGVGGIATEHDAQARLEAGATLLQAYTGLVYGGPWWPRRILRGLR